MAMIQKGKYPVPYIGITQYYSKAHPALDLGWGTPNPPISSALDGEVAVATTDTDGAKYVVIRHDNAIAGKRVYTLYWHLASYSVKKGNKVKRGDKIGVMGQTGNASGVHLHFEFWICPEGYSWALKDKAKYAVDPQKYVYRFSEQELSSNAAATKGVLTYTGEDKPADTKPASLPPAGTQKYLSHVPLYASATAAEPANYISGRYYLWDTNVISGRVRITNMAVRVGVADQVTGWVAASVFSGGTQTYTVKEGDTLSGIAAKYGVELDALIAANPQIKNPDLIYAGDKVTIP